MIRSAPVAGEARKQCRTRGGTTSIACTLPGNKLSRGADFQAQAVLEDRAFDDAAWYLERRYLSEFDASQFDFVTARIDRDVLAGGGYAASDIAA